MKGRTQVWGTNKRAANLWLRVWGLESGYWVRISALPPTSCSALVKVLTSVSLSAKWGNKVPISQGCYKDQTDEAGGTPSAGLESAVIAQERLVPLPGARSVLRLRFDPELTGYASEKGDMVPSAFVEEEMLSF